MFPRIQTLDARIRASEVFPRIRDAEEAMKRNEKEFFEKLKLKESKLRRKKEKLKKKQVIIAVNPTIQKIKELTPQKQYFTGFVLNKDPHCSQYMPFDEVYFPKLFNGTNAKTTPETIDNLWMLGFEDFATRKTEAQKQKAKPQINV
jgi:hypothetical protein